MRYVKNLLWGMVFCFTATAAMAGSILDNPAAPTNADSAMYKLEDVYNRANDGTAGTKRTTTYGEPIAAPGSTGHTLTQAYDLVSERSRPAKTGQILCYDPSSPYSVITCGATTAGQDGNLQKGVKWPSPRFTDNLVSGTSNGTVTDNLTGLIWLKVANYNSTTSTTGTAARDAALTFCNALHTGQCGLTDDSKANDWRLPNLRELQSLIDYANARPALPTGHPFTGVQSGFYWSSTSAAANTGSAWGVSLDDGGVYLDTKTLAYYVWPVRGGQ
jgi:hypothetical protein